MNLRPLLIVLSFFLVPALALLPAESEPAASRSAQKPIQEQRYETRAIHDPDGIGKFYMGREIAQVMGHEGAAWLERRERLKMETPDEVVRQMRLKPTDVVADIGAGTGYFSFRLSRVVPQGKVYAVDIQPEMLAMIEQRKATTGAGNVVALLGTEMDTKLPAQAVTSRFW